MKKVKGLIAVLILLIILVSAGVTFVGFYLGDIDYKRDTELFISARGSSTTEYVAFDGGREIEVFRAGNGGFKEWTQIELLGENIKKAFISSEDRAFYSHNGINIRRSIQAAFSNIISKGQSYGASTITQQVIKNISGDSERTLRRKLCEILRAIHLEREFTKEEILEIYLNIVPMSGNIVGVCEAASSYFGKEPSELTIAECATIAGVTNSPNKYCPIRHPKESMEKRNRVLFAMLDNGAISEAEYKQAVEEPLNTVLGNNQPSEMNWFVETAKRDVINDIIDKYSVSESAARLMLKGAKIYITEDIRIQRILEDVFYNADSFPKIENMPRYAMVVMDNSSGNLVGIVGGVGEKKASGILNYATTRITPASTIKPLSIYAPLIEDGKINMATLLEDAPISVKTVNGEEIGYPRNSPNIYSGFISVADALRLSKNTVAMRLCLEMGEEWVFDRLTRDYGLDLVRTSVNDGKALTDLGAAPLSLGQLTNGISLREVTRCYTTFARGGVLGSGRSYYAALTFDGKIIVESNTNDRRIYSPSTASIMTALLSGVVENGTASSVRLKYSVDTAGKTGTSSNNLDRVFIGYTPYYTAGVWCGYADGSTPVPKINPSHIAIWDEVMIRIHNNIAPQRNPLSFDMTGVIRLEFCPNCGGLAGQSGEKYVGYFINEDDIKHSCSCNNEGDYTECRH